MNKYFWFSFSYRGQNNGVCLIEADSPEEADDKIIALNLVPSFDDVKCFQIDNAEIELNRLFSYEELVDMGYMSETTTK